MNIQEIIQEELAEVVLESITKNFTKAIETYKKIQLHQQDLRKAFVSEKDPKKKEKLKQALIKLHKKVQRAEQEFNSALRTEPVDNLDEVKLNEDATDELGKDIKAKVYKAHGGGRAEAQATKKVWDDGVPVLKYIARAPKKTVKLPRKFRVVDDTKHGWWYYFDKGVWYGIDQDTYGTPPFEY